MVHKKIKYISEDNTIFLLSCFLGMK
jgi:hypothetical protein